MKLIQLQFFGGIQYTFTDHRNKAMNLHTIDT